MESFRIVLCLAIAAALSGPVGAYFTCRQIEDCFGIESMECVNGRCVCPPGRFLNANNTECIKTASYIMGECTEDLQCKRLYVGFHCDEETNRCKCSEGFRYLDGRCWPASNYGEPCVANQQCYHPLLPYSLGCKDGLCDCADGYYFRHRGYCRKIAYRIGDSCIQNFDCQIPGKPNVGCIGSKCVELNTNREAIIEAITPVAEVELYDNRAVNEGDVCETDQDCEGLPYSECSEYRHCECKFGYYADANRQNCVGEMGRTSTKKICDTLQMATFQDGVCDCPNGFFYTENARFCIKATRFFNESCANDISCYTFGSGGICVQNPANQFLKICDCNSTISTKNEDQQLCIPIDKVIGENCTQSPECPVGADCTDGWCQCANGTVSSSDSNFCLEVNLALGDECKESMQCGNARTDCIDGKCTCGGDFFEENGVCKTGIGFVCESDADCDFPNSHCISFNQTKTCDCDDTSVQGADRCLKKAEKLGNACDETIQCADLLGGLQAVNCSQSVCACSQTHHPRDDLCWPITTLGELCTTTSQCYLSGNQSERTHCRNSICQCTWDYARTFQPDGCNGSNAVRGGVVTLIISIILTVFIMK